jgi:PHS family inorganic phosphate transporter-like MFS transporter
MSFIGLLCFWRIIVGIGVGAGYPLSAVITSEFAPTEHRSRMLASVFFGQPLGYLLATLMALGVTMGKKSSIPTDRSVLSCTLDNECREAVDSAWRWVVGIGAIPAALAIVSRFFIPESPLYTMDVLNRPLDAKMDLAEERNGTPPQIPLLPF